MTEEGGERGGPEGRERERRRREEETQAGEVQSWETEKEHEASGGAV